MLLNFCSSAPIVRLADGGTPKQGRVEINVGGVWGTVCSWGWDINDAQVVCRMLNLSAATAAPRYAAFGEGRGPTWFAYVQCTGNETSLLNCSHDGLWDSFCGYFRDAGVVCGSAVTGSKQSIVHVVSFIACF